MVQITNLDEKVREQLRHKIISGEMAGGFHLSELKISKEFSVSRTPVREALCALAADGLIEMIPHRGAFVTNVPQDIRVDQYRTYGMFMGMVAKLACENGNIELLLDLETAVAALTDAASENEDSYNDALTQVNSMLRAAAGSSTVAEALEMVTRRANVAALWNQAYAQRKEMTSQYKTLLAAIKAKKVDDAEKTMRTIMASLTNPVVAMLNTHAAKPQVAN
ncbi:MAG: GntR family transcriptional regulator [Alphaproteobacteria bacterium]